MPQRVRPGGVRLTERRSVVVISDWVDGVRPAGDDVTEARVWATIDPALRPWSGGGGAPVTVAGGYLERLPLALVAAGVVEQAEIWHHWRGAGPPPFHRETAVLARRAFRIDHEDTPYRSADMLAFVQEFGAPHVLIVLGLGVAPALLELCAASTIIYNSIDAPALRVPPAVSARFDLVITGAQWQSDACANATPTWRR